MWVTIHPSPQPPHPLLVVTVEAAAVALVGVGDARDGEARVARADDIVLACVPDANLVRH